MAKGSLGLIPFARDFEGVGVEEDDEGEEDEEGTEVDEGVTEVDDSPVEEVD